MGFFRKLEDEIKEIGRDIDDNILQPIKENPIGTIVGIGGMALGIPPVYAGALAGGANAAANGTNILEGALLGGATGYVGGAAAGAAARAGAGAVLSGAAGGAASGAAGAAFTGNDIGKGALFGGLAGGATGYLSDLRGGESAPVEPAPVYDYDPATGTINPAGSNTPLNILDADQTADLMRNVDPRLVNNFAEGGGEYTGGGGGDGNYTGGGGGDDGVFRVEVEGLPGSAENPSYAKAEFRTPGTELATFEQIDNGTAKYNMAANAWEVGAPAAPTVPTPVYDGPEFYQFDDGSTLTIGRDGKVTSTDTFGRVFTPGGGSAYLSEGGGTTYKFDDGSWMTINPDGSSTFADIEGNVRNNAGGTYTGRGSGGETTDLGELVITTPRLTGGDTTDLGEIVITTTRLPKDSNPVYDYDDRTTTTTPVTTTPVTTTPVTTTPTTPIFPIIPPVTPGTGGGGGTTATPGGPIRGINLPPGLQPGFMNPTPFYNTTSPAQSQFSWGARGFQPGPTFDAKLYNQAPAPETPWGIQNIAQPLTPQEVTRAYQGQPIVRPPLPVATRYEAPVTQVLQTTPYTPTAPGFTPQQIANTPGMGVGGIGVNIQPLPVQFVTGPVAPR